MYAIHFVLFVEMLVLNHILQLCLKSYANDKAAEEAESSGDSQSAAEEEENDSCPFAPWSGWSECTVTCGNGLSVRHRIVLILENCTGDMVQEKVCSKRSCPHEKEYIFQRKEDEDGSKSSGADEDQQETTHHEPDMNHENKESQQSLDHRENHFADFNSAPRDNFQSENNPDGDAETQEDGFRGRERGHSWTSDDGGTWGRQSSFESHGEGDNCFSDCSPSDPPTENIGSPRSSHRDSEHGEPRATQHEDDDSFAEEKKEGKERVENENEESHEKETDDNFKEKRKLNDGKLKHDDDVSHDEDDRFDAETDLDDDNDFDDDDYDDDDADQDENEPGKESNKKQKRCHDEEEEEGEQDDLEQEEESEDKDKRSRKKKRRRRKQKKKKSAKEERQTERNPDAVCDPTHICDTFMAAVESVCADVDETTTSSESANKAALNEDQLML